MASGGAPGSRGGIGGAAAPATLGHRVRPAGAGQPMRVADPRERDAADDDRAADDLPGRIGSPRKMTARTTASAGTSVCRAVTRVGPSWPIPLKTTTFATPAASAPE